MATSARVEECMTFARDFFGSVSLDMRPSSILEDLSLPAAMAIDPRLLHPSHGTQADHGVVLDDGNMKHHPTIDPAQAIKPETTEILKSAKHAHMPMVINPELFTRITNTVHSTELVDVRTGQPATLPLNKIARALFFLASQYNTERFAKLVQRYGPSIRLTQLIFATGKIVETGRVSFDGKRAQMMALIDLIHAAGYPHINIGRRICQNIVSTGKLSFQLRLSLLKLRFGDSIVYNPEYFAGAIIRHPALTTMFDDYEDDLPDAAATQNSEYMYMSVDSIADEKLDDPEAMQAANAYARRVIEESGGDLSNTAAIEKIMDECLSRQKDKKIVVLAFKVGMIICGGAKNVRMLRRAYAIVFEMLSMCRDTPENRLLEEQYLRERGPLVPSPIPADPKKKPGRVPRNSGRTKPHAILQKPMDKSGVVKRRRGRPRKVPLTVQTQ